MTVYHDDKVKASPKICKKPSDWRERFLCDLFGAYTAALPDFDRAWDKALATIKPRYATILRLRYQESKSIDAISKELNITTYYAQQYLKKAIYLMRRPERKDLFVYGVDYCTEQQIKQSNAEQHAIESLAAMRCLNVTECDNTHSAVALNTNISDINFSTRLAKRLQLAGCKTLEDVLCFRLQDVYKLRNIGDKSVAELCAYLLDHNLTLRPDNLGLHPRVFVTDFDAKIRKT